MLEIETVTLTMNSQTSLVGPVHFFSDSIFIRSLDMKTFLWVLLNTNDANIGDHNTLVMPIAIEQPTMVAYLQ